MRSQRKLKIPQKVKLDSPIKTKNQSKIVYNANCYLAVRNEQDDFYICKVVHDFFNKQKKIRIQWLEAVKDGIYAMSFMDNIFIDSVISKVTLAENKGGQFILDGNEKDKILKDLHEALDDQIEDDSDEKEPPIKQTKKVMNEIKPMTMERKKKSTVPIDDLKPIKKRKSITTDVVRKGANKVMNKVTSKVTNKVTNKETTSVTQKRGKLIPRSSIKLIDKNPLLFAKDEVPFISTNSYSKLIFRAITDNDAKQLKRLIEDSEHVSKILVDYSIDVTEDPLNLALKLGHVSLVEMILKEITNVKRTLRAAPTKSLLDNLGTGLYNKASLGGLPNIRTLAASRGSKEGNNAFTKDAMKNVKCGDQFDGTKYIGYCLKNGIDMKIINKIIASDTNLIHVLHRLVHYAIRAGHRALAAEIIRSNISTGSNQFNNLHLNVLEYKDKELDSTIRAASVKKQAWESSKITPLHCSAINPNVYYLKTLLQILPEINLSDVNGFRPIHYAAACDGPDPLIYLLERGAMADEANSEGMTALMIAAHLNKTHNIKTILEHAKRTTGTIDVGKYGLAGINRPCVRSRIFAGYTTIHYAALNNSIEAVKVLVEYGLEVDKPLGASKNKITALIIASQKGFLQMVQLLIVNCAKAQYKDKLKRTALMHACINGQTHIVSYLVSLGCSLNDADSSNNTPLHYSAAYGWFYTTMFILNAGALPNQLNDWKTSPLAVAFLKGHTGMAELLLTTTKADINFKLDCGMTLLMSACCGWSHGDSIDQICYLVVDKLADCRLVDDEGCNALHHLALNAALKECNEQNDKEECLKAIIQIADLLIEHKCDLSALNNDAKTPAVYAIQSGNGKLALHLIKAGGAISSGIDNKGYNTLHFLAEQCLDGNMAPILQSIIDNCKIVNLLDEMGQTVNNDGYTPLLLALHTYKIGQNSDHKKKPAIDYKICPRQKHFDNDDNECSYIDDDENEDDNGEDDNEIDDVEMEPKPRQTIFFSKDDLIDYFKFVSILISQCFKCLSIPVQKKKINSKVANKFAQTAEINEYAFKDEAGYTAFHFVALMSENNEIANLVLSYVKDANDLNIKNYYGLTPIMTSIINHNEICAKLLIKYGCDVTILNSDINSSNYGSALHLAAMYDEHGLIEDLLKHGALVNQSNLLSQNTLHLVILNPGKDMDETIKTLIKYGANVKLVDKFKRTAFHYLAAYSSVNKQYAQYINGMGLKKFTAIVDGLIKAGLSINARDMYDRTPLHIAVMLNEGGSNSSTNIEEIFIDRGADLMMLDCHKRLPLHYAFITGGKKYKLKDNKIDPIEHCTLLINAAKDVNRMLQLMDLYGFMPIHYAAALGAGVCCLSFLKKLPNVDETTDQSNSPLSLAVLNKHQTCSLLLVQQMANVSGYIYLPTTMKTNDDDDDYANDHDDANDQDVKEYDENDYKPSDEAETKIFLKKWSWEPIRFKNKLVEFNKKLILEGIIENEWQGMTFMIIDRMKQSSFKLSTIIKITFTTNKYNISLRLMQKIKNNEFFTLFDNARSLAHVLALNAKAASSDEQIVAVATILFDNGVRFDCIDEYDYCAIHYACFNCNKPLIMYIAKTHGAKIFDSAFGKSPICALFWNLDTRADVISDILNDIKQWLIPKYFDVLMAYVNAKKFWHGHPLDKTQFQADYFMDSDCDEISPLILCILQHNYEIIRFLIRAGADVNFCDKNGKTPIMYAANENDVESIGILLDVNHSDQRADKLVLEGYYDFIKDTSEDGWASNSVNFPKKKKVPTATLR